MVDTQFIDELASAAPVPGGGGASAYCGALASAAASMVANLTVGKKRYANVEDDVRKSLTRLEDIRARLLKLIDLDAKAFTPLAAAYKMPADTPEQIADKDLAMQSALIGACDVPLDIMHACVEVLDECDFLARSGSRMAISDAGVAAALAKAALQAASLNIYININSMTDASLVEKYHSETDKLFTKGTALGDEIFDFVLAKIEGNA